MEVKNNIKKIIILSLPVIYGFFCVLVMKQFPEYNEFWIPALLLVAGMKCAMMYVFTDIELPIIMALIYAEFILISLSYFTIMPVAVIAFGFIFRMKMKKALA